MATGADDPDGVAGAVPFAEAVRAWVAVAAASFGGPAGQVAAMHEQVVARRGWVDDDRFLGALNFTMLLPGPEAHQLAVYLGWLLHGVRGGVVAGTLFVLPGFLSMLAVGVVYVLFRSTPVVSGLLFGLQPPSSPWWRSRWSASAGGRSRARSSSPSPPPRSSPCTPTARRSPSSSPARGSRAGWSTGSARRSPPTRGATLRTAVVWTAAWLVPLVPLVLVFGVESVFVVEALFFGGVAAVSFGGAYAALAFVAQQAVDGFGWLSADEMLEGIGVAEPLPGPLIKVVQFVAFLGAYRSPGGLDPLVAGLLGATVAGWFTYLPSYLWIFVGAPYVERLREHAGLSAALAAVTAAVVGVIANLGTWFGVRALFGARATVAGLGARVVVPVPVSVDPASAAVAALLAVWRLRQPVPRTLLVAAGLGLVLRTAGVA